MSSVTGRVSSQSMRWILKTSPWNALRASSKRNNRPNTLHQLCGISYSAFRDGDFSSDHPDNDKIFLAAKEAHSSTSFESLIANSKTQSEVTQDYGPLPSIPKDLLPIDQNAIEFHADKHVYTYKGHKIPSSVTQVISSYFPGFNKHEQIQKMMTGDNWPRPEYTHPITNIPFTKEEILLQWARISKEALMMGTKLHVYIENVLKDWNVVQGWMKESSDNNSCTNLSATAPAKTEDLEVEKQQIASFLRHFLQKKNIALLATEMRLVAPDLGIAGSVDFIGRYIDPQAKEITNQDITFAPGQDRVVLIDWKRSKDLALSAFMYYNKYGKEPWGHIPACDGYKYALQVNLYRYILQRYYQITVDDMYIVSFHPDQELPMDHDTADSIGFYLQEQPLIHTPLPQDLTTHVEQNTSNVYRGRSFNNAVITPFDPTAFSAEIEEVHRKHHNNHQTTTDKNIIDTDTSMKEDSVVDHDETDMEDSPPTKGYYILKVANLQEDIERMLRHHVHSKLSHSYNSR